MDELLTELRRKWELTGLDSDAIEYLRALYRSGQPFNLLQFPIHLLSQLKIDDFGESNSTMIVGHSVKTLLEKISEEVADFTITKSFPDDEKGSEGTRWALLISALSKRNWWRQQFDINHFTDYSYEDYLSGRLAMLYHLIVALSELELFFSAVWYPHESRIGVFIAGQVEVYDMRQILRSITVTPKGRIDDSKLGDLATPPGYLVKFDFDLRLGHFTSYQCLHGEALHCADGDPGFWRGVSRDDLIAYFKGNSNDFLILRNEIEPTNFIVEIPEISYDRCEDYPACGHDFCPPHIEGQQVAMVCTCGKFLPVNNRFSICDACLRSDDDDDGYREQFENEQDFEAYENEILDRDDEDDLDE